MLCSLDWESVDGVVVDHVCYARERSAKLAENIMTARGGLYSHVHKSCTAPEIERVVIIAGN